MKWEKNHRELLLTILDRHRYILNCFSFSVINAENAAHKSDKFLTMATRTRQEYLKDLATNYVTNTPIDTGSKLSKILLIVVLSLISIS